MAKWLNVYGDVYLCSECKQIISFYGVDPEHVDECPLCGAEMENDRKEADDGRKVLVD